MKEWDSELERCPPKSMESQDPPTNNEAAEPPENSRRAGGLRVRR